MAEDNSKVVLDVEVNGAGAVAGANTVKNAMKDMADGVKNSANQAGAALDDMGDQGPKAEAKLTGANKSIASQMERQIALFRSAGKSTADFYEELIKTRKNLDPEQLAPYLARMREAELAHKSTGASMQGMGLSAKQMQAAMRGLPAQFTDIFTSLASGQTPMLVLLQQGGQIKDMFGGLVPALKAVGSGLLAMVNPFTVVAAAVAALGLAFYQGAAEQKQFRDALRDSGNVAGTTVDDLTEMAKSMDSLTGATQGAATDALELFVRTTKVGATSLQDFTTAAIELERAGGQAIEQTAKAFADLGKDPVKALEKLNESMNFLSMAGYEQVRALEEVGRTTDASKLAMELYANAIKERAKDMEANLGLVEKAWRGIKDITKETWDFIKGIGRESTSQEKLVSVQERIAALQERLKNPEKYGGADAAANYQRQLADLRERESILQSELRLSKQAATVQQEHAELVRRRIQYEKDGEQFKTKAIKLAEEERRLQQDLTDGVITQLEYEKRIALVREKYKDTGKKGDPFAADRGAAQQWASIMEKIGTLTAKADGDLQNLNKSQTFLLQLLKDPVFQRMPENWRQTALQALYAAVEIEKAADAEDEAAKVRERLNKESEKQIDAQFREIEAINKKAEKLEVEAAALGLTKGKQDALRAAIIDTEIARLTAYQNSDMYAQEDQRAQQAIDDRVKALERLRDGYKNLSEAKDAKQAADDVEKAWVKSANSIGSALTQSLTDAFFGGESMVDGLVNYIKTAFKSVVVRFGIEPIVKGMIGTGMAAFGAPASAIESFTGINAASGASSLFNMPSWATSWEGLGNSVYGATGSGALGDFVGVAGEGLSYLSALWALKEKQYGQAIGTAVGSYFFGPIGAFAGGTIGSWIDKMGKKWWGGGGPKVGGSFESSPVPVGVGDDWVWRANGQGRLFSETQLDKEAKDVATGWFKTLTDVVVGLGGSTANMRYGIGWASDPEGDAPNRVAAFVNDLYLNNPDIERSEEAMADGIAKTIMWMTLAGLQEADMPAVYKEWFDNLDLDTLTQEQLDSAIAVALAAKAMAETTASLGGAFTQLSHLSIEARDSIMQMTGGLDSFLQKAGTFVDLYYTEQEKMAIQGYEVAKVLAEAGLNISGLDTKDEFRDMFERIDASTELGQQQMAAMLNVAGAFASISDYLINNNIDLDELSGGIVNRILGTNVVVGPGAAIPDEVTEAAPWLADLKEFWTTTTTTISEPMTNLVNATTEAGSKTAQAIDNLAIAVSGYADAVNQRPVEVTVNVETSQINGGALA